MLSGLRREMQGILAAVPAPRKPALRRADIPGALLATDLSLIAQEDDVSAFIAVAYSRGWRVDTLANGWLALDHDVPVPEADVPAMPAGEIGCCLALLLRHPGGAVEKEYIRALVKADEDGKIALEKLCRLWHGKFAARLREHRALPDVLAYLCAAICHHNAKEDA